jgi:hypothetical protein
MKHANIQRSIHMGMTQRKIDRCSMALLLCIAPLAVLSDDEAAMTAEVYAIAKSAKNEAVMQHLTDPSQYDAMAKARAENPVVLRENLRVDEVKVEHIDETHAIARPTYREKHTGTTGQEEIHLEMKNGKWQVTSPPPAAE